MSEVLRVDPAAPDAASVARAAEILRAGGLVAIPTETVYGLAAHALDARAVERIFAAKGRPSTNPLIVHVPDVASARALSSHWPAAADRLAERFWPGPLTLVVPRAAVVPDVVTAGGDTVAIRVPAHPVALAILRAARIPLAAPSANPSNAVSPTTAQHVVAGLGKKVDLVVDGGPCSGGIESTVLHLDTDPPTLLRPGLVSPDAIEAVIGPIARERKQQGPLPSPGLMARHYAPRAKLEVVHEDRARDLAAVLAAAGERVALLVLDDAVTPAVVRGVQTVVMPRQADAYASRLYATLHQLDSQGFTRVVVVRPPDGDAWLGVRDRLARASHA